MRAIADRPGQGLVLLTATPHSGKTDEFRSLLGLLDARYEGWDILSAGEQERRELAERYVQRRRKDVELWQGLHSSERTPFPRRDSQEIPYTLAPAYRRFYERLHAFARALVADATGQESVHRMRYWSALTLLRGAMSSPASGLEMIRVRTEGDTSETGDEDDPLYDREEQGIGDSAAGPILSRARWSASQRAALNALAEELSGLVSLENDAKANKALEIVTSWVSEGLRPVVFCKFIATANHLGSLLKPILEREFPDFAVEVVTSEDPDEVRKARVEDMADCERRVLIATDCLSEGINLQEHFSAVLHYDLPWNPNRLEQREGRVDRYGQTAPVVKACLLYGADNPIDGVVLRVLLRKVREIKSSIGISIPFPEDSLNLMDAVMQAVLLSDPGSAKTGQLELGLESESRAILMASNEVQEASRREEATRSIFAQRSIHPEEIEEDLAAVDRALGEPADVEAFALEVTQRVVGAPAKRLKGGRCHSINTANLPAALREDLQRIPALGPGKPARSRAEIKVGFESPVPDGFLHIGRMHPFVESLCRQVLMRGFEGGGKSGLGRAAAVRTREVSEKTVLLLFRARHILEDTRKGVRLVAEEAVLCGYEGSARERRFLSDEKARSLMESASVSSDLSNEARREAVSRELADAIGLEAEWLRVARERAMA
ncbi:MAG: DEAD/DEAH box helicase, partial [Acidobacteria bacterium]|nr:DEAD/DEAH box helicase [Acidobacteriota bacterium]